MEIINRKIGTTFTEKEFKRSHPNTSFPAILTRDVLDCFGCDIVFVADKPEMTFRQTVTLGDVEFANGRHQRSWIVKDIVFSEEEELQITRTQFNNIKAEITTKINALFEQETATIKGNVMHGEVDTFGTQEKEALGFIANDTFPTPLLNGLATVRGITVSELAVRVLAHAETYKHAVGLVMGKKHALEDQVDKAETLDDLKLIEVK